MSLVRVHTICTLVAVLRDDRNLAMSASVEFILRTWGNPTNSETAKYLILFNLIMDIKNMRRITKKQTRYLPF